LHTQDGIHIGVQEGQLEIGWAEYKPRIEQYLAMPAMITNAKPVAAKVVGDTGWGVWTFTNEIGEGDQKMASETRLTLVFEKVDGKWLVSHSHVSAGMPPMAPPSAEK
jgi:ketosteroid isomerase-like protein